MSPKDRTRLTPRQSIGRLLPRLLGRSASTSNVTRNYRPMRGQEILVVTRRERPVLRSSFATVQSRSSSFSLPFGTCVPCGMFPGVKTPGYSQDVPPGQRNVAPPFSSSKQPDSLATPLRDNLPGNGSCYSRRAAWLTVLLLVHSGPAAVTVETEKPPIPASAP